MNKVFILLLLLISFSCDKEKEFVEKKGPIIYTSEIFSGKDTLIYGRWELFWSSNFSRKNNEILNIRPIGQYEKFVEGELFETGKIDTFHNRIAFCSDGIKSNIIKMFAYYEYDFKGVDTLYLYIPEFDDGYQPWYKRIK